MKHLQHEDPQSTCKTCGLISMVPRLSGHPMALITDSPPMQKVLQRVARLSESEAPLVILGETGTGKEVIARILHANSPRKDKPFVAVNVGALPRELLESELFGHGKGAFTGATRIKRGLFEEADGGTLFLDEVAELPMPLQVKLLRALQGGEVRRVGENKPFAVDVRIVSATHQNLLQAIKDGRFRQDLYYRLKVLSIRVPPLRDRKDDVLPLAAYFLEKEGRQLRGFSEACKKALLAYDWPGNVRELQNAVRHGAALALSDWVELEDLPEEIEGGTLSCEDEALGQGGCKTCAPALLPSHNTGEGQPLSTELCSLAEAEKQHILRVLDALGGSQTEAAMVLGIARTTLWRKLRAYAEEEERFLS